MRGFVPLTAFDALEDRLAARGLHLQLFTDSRLLPGIDFDPRAAIRLAGEDAVAGQHHVGRKWLERGPEHTAIARDEEAALRSQRVPEALNALLLGELTPQHRHLGDREIEVAGLQPGTARADSL